MTTTKASARKPKASSKEGIAKAWPTEGITDIGALSVIAKPEYVAWIDLMGARGWMAGSIRRAAEMIALIHVAGHRAAKKYNVKVYPVIDGIYLIGEEKRQFRSATSLVMRILAATFLARDKQDRRFLVRGGIAYGRVLHGADIAKIHDDLESDPAYASCLALGIAIGQAFEAEKKAPPFGYYVDFTARSTASENESPYISAFSRWWNVKTQSIEAQKFGSQIENYFEYLESRRHELEYSEDRMKQHRNLAKEYFNRLDEAITFQQATSETGQ